MKNNNKKYEKMFNEFIQASFDADVSVSVTKQDRWVNISLALWNGKAFAVKDKKAMSVQLRRPAVKELIEKLQQALAAQENEWDAQGQAISDDEGSNEPISLPDDWSDKL